MTEVMERRTTTARMLYETITEYIQSNKHSRDVNERWLCTALLEPLLATIGGVMNRNLPEDKRKAVADFRAAEIENEIAMKRAEIHLLERDLATTKL